MAAKKKTKKQKKQDSIAKKILDKYATVIITKDAIYEENGASKPNLNKATDYIPKKYSEDIVLWIPPKDCIRLEFEYDDYKTNLRCIRECENACKTLDIDYGVTEHKGGKSPYMNIFNIKGIPVNEDNPIAKSLLIDLLASNVVKEGLDRSNLGWTYSPVIGHQHWKKKYNGAIHKIIRGKNPLEHENEYPKKLLIQIKKSKTQYKYDAIQVQQNYPWVIDFLVKYCPNNKLPVGNRNLIVEKNLAIAIVHRKDRDKIMVKYLKMQERKHNSLTGWFNKVIKGEIKQVSVGELKKYIQDNNIDYTIIDQKTKEEKSYIVSHDEQTLLTDPNLLDVIDAEFDKTIVGENESRKAIFLNACGKYVKNANITSFNLCINSNSGAGKDYICKNVLKIFPKSDVETRSRISPTALTYWHDSHSEPDFSWDGKILSLMDISNSILNCDVFKLFCSDESNSIIVIDGKARDIKINGKPVMTITTASASPNNETLRRFPFLELDETIDQTKAIKKAQAKAAAVGITLDYNPLITKVLEKLKRVQVKVPFAEDLVEFFPDAHLIMRTHFLRLLDYIKASAALYQKQRKVDENGFVVAEPQDYDNAIILLKKTTTNPMMIPLSKKQRMLLAKCKEMDAFSVKQIEPYVPFYVQSKLYTALGALQENGFLYSFLDDSGESKKPIRRFRYIEFELDQIPTWEKIQEECRKKGIEGREGIRGIEGREGIDGIDKEKEDKTDKKTMINNNKNNSLNSLNSLPILTSEHKKNDKKSLHKKVMEVKKYIEKVISAGHTGVSDTVLFDNFEAGVINGLFESGQLIKTPGKDLYVWSSG